MRGSRAALLAVTIGLLSGCGAPAVDDPAFDDPAEVAPAAAGPQFGPAVPPPASGAPGLAAPLPPADLSAGSTAPQPDPPAPLALSIPSLGVQTGSLLALGLDGAGALEVPPDAEGTGWYVHSPAPGDLGPSVIAAHVDYDGRPGVFSRLAELAPGAAVSVRRADGTVVTFVVSRVERYAKSAFPSAEVYGNTPGPELRLITCGGVFDNGTGHYQDNVVAYAIQV